MKPILEWYEDLPEPYRSQAIEAAGNHVRHIKVKDQSTAILQGTILAKEGKEYWLEINRMVLRGDFNNEKTNK